MTSYRALVDDGDHSETAGELTSLKEAIDCYVKCILNTEEGELEVEIISVEEDGDYIDITSHEFTEPIARTQRKQQDQVRSNKDLTTFTNYTLSGIHILKQCIKAAKQHQVNPEPNSQATKKFNKGAKKLSVTSTAKQSTT